MTIDVITVDAFVANGKGGSPAGVALDGDGLTEVQMQWIAKQLTVPETAVFILSDSSATHRLRFFTPTQELSLCGHAAIGAWSLMFERGLHSAGVYTQATKAGLLKISIENDGSVFMEMPEQKFGNTIGFSDISNNLEIEKSNFDNRFKPQIVRGNLIVGIKTKDLLHKLSLDKQRIIEFGENYKFECLHLFTLLKNEGAIAIVRNFDPSEGIDEDIATGTTNGSLLAYLKNQHALPRQALFKIVQGENFGRRSFIIGKFQENRIWIGGRTKIGELHNLIFNLAVK